MATFCKFPAFLSLPTHKIFTNGYPPRRSSGVCGCSTRKPRGGRRVKSNVELCTEIREFISAFGLPDDHVPTTKELVNHGRTDLANIVRRRGYKVVRDLLSNATELENDKLSSSGTCLSSEQEAGCGQRDVLTGQGEKVGYTVEDGSLFMSSNNSIKLDEEEKQLLDETSLSTSSHYVEPPVKEVLGILQGNSLSNEGLMLNDCELRVQDEHNSSEDVSALFEAPNREASESSDDNFSGGIFSDGRILSESTSCSSVEEKVEKFIRSGELDTIEDNFSGLLSESATDEIEEVNKHEKELTVQSQILSERKFQHNAGGSDETQVVNGNALASKNNMVAEGIANADLDQDLDAETSRREKQVEINRLKFMLHQKELELSHLKEQIEKEKLALSALQTKAETEIKKAQKLVSDKDAELIAAEESLSGLVEVKVQYSGDGNTVEVAGSFNGWHHRIRMDTEPLSTGTNNGGSRRSPLWSALLWLYPGVYEIKFVVDGQWVVDPKRESVTKAGICNNVLRVD